MQTYLLLMLVLSPFLIATILAFTSSLSLVLVLVSAIAGSLLIILSGLFWLQLLHRNWIESQAAGFIFVPVVLPFLAYTGAIAGASLVAILTIYGWQPASSGLFWTIAIALTVVLAGLMPSAIAPLLLLFETTDVSKATSPVALLPVLAMVAGVTSSFFASLVAHFLTTRFISLHAGL